MLPKYSVRHSLRRLCLVGVGLFSSSIYAEPSQPVTSETDKTVPLVNKSTSDPFDESFFSSLPSLSKSVLPADRPEAPLSEKSDGSAPLLKNTLPSTPQTVSNEQISKKSTVVSNASPASGTENLQKTAVPSSEKSVNTETSGNNQADINNVNVLAADLKADKDNPIKLDPALSQPLPDIANVTPDTNQHLVIAKDTRDIHYKVSVNGLEDIDVNNAFKTYSVLLSNKNKADSLSVIGARAASDRNLIERILRSQGYYDGTSSLTIMPADKGRYNVQFKTDPGALYRLDKIEITGSSGIPLKIARQALNLERGDPIIADKIEMAENNVALTLPHQGYPFAKIGDRSILLDGDTHKGDYTLPIDVGPLGYYGNIIVSNNKHVVLSATHIAHMARFKQGQRYDGRMIDDLRQALAATSLFSHVSVEPIHTGRKTEDGSEIVDLDVRQGRGKKHSIAVTGGYGTGEGFKAQGSWTNRNYLPPEGALTFSGILGTRQQQLSALFIRNNAGLRDRVIQLGLTAGRERYDAYNGYSFSLGGSLSRQSTQIWQKRWTYSIGAELTQTNERSYNFSRGERLTNSYLIAALPSQLGYDRSNNLMNPTKGYRLNLRLSPETSIGSGLRGYMRMIFDASGYYPIVDNVVVAGRVRVASIEGANVQEIAPSRRMYAGGGGSVRGYGYQQLGPKDPYNDAVGGLSEEELAFEVRYRFGNFGIVPFIDAGQVYEDSLPTFHNLRFGTGIGGRYYTAFGPFRVDLATPIARQPGESRISVYVSIGQAF
ncbi:MAG: BamA/TamA family outer membrane protein [Zymomonas mobilis subsp. pomaceae]|uniref:Surface antigen (D15) n=1 Tax=Zymomonas mobilis subsp. pomaceae (strain ATCC 29192 / DSM 22645 / JCM 10191 / CCUG 17912 / NBRC 13757 / NCIMB 11200 / NRRL B-4491 / Barker I) TaxID=579138 RepID=F8ETM1_ZYMMT|nr:BamA/TamA family outer membrane protein [Zymomonas mobilis]AEI37031.1 surface antigen (D15) [Zymomonas mobilis subsp. pomaceae ATCC 29192]MDX5948403.1 BamA/TamA family outer membrane protein [Zymomonas mobilis subsp. pomaceae]GEB89607.1 hypothetical protein ZMO02_12440 [Zymomonas mobilis subsp. pomaceae]